MNSILMNMKIDEQKIWESLEKVKDPEIPVLSVVDLGVIRKVEVGTDNIKVTITPTYSGCPAMKEIEFDIMATLGEDYDQKINVHTVLSPAWTTDWLTDSGRQKLLEYGISPPADESKDKSQLFQKPKNVVCPVCGSYNTEMKSQFGSTACKSLYQCLDCKEPFDYFKCH